MKHIISVVVENKFGVLSRVSGLFSGRGYNIESLTVNETDKDGISMMTIVTNGDDPVIEQIIKQLRKLVNVLTVRDITAIPGHIERELVLVKLHVMPKHRAEIFGIISAFRGNVVDITHESMIIEVIGSGEKIQAFVEVVRPYGLIEVVKTGVLAMTKGATTTTESGNK